MPNVNGKMYPYNAKGKKAAAKAKKMAEKKADDAGMSKAMDRGIRKGLGIKD